MWPPMLVIIWRSSSSGCRISRLKNSMTPRNSMPLRMGKPTPACSPSLAASGPRVKVPSWVKSAIQVGLPLAEEPQGRIVLAVLRRQPQVILDLRQETLGLMPRAGAGERRIKHGSRLNGSNWFLLHAWQVHNKPLRFDLLRLLLVPALRS